MKNWKRIVLVVIVLLGGTTTFAFWSLQEFNNVFDNLSASQAAVYTFVPRQPTFATTTEETATSTASTSEAFSEQEIKNAKFQPIFSFAPKKKGVYVGCTYKITWLPPASIQSLELALVDSGTRRPIGPKASGLAQENPIEASAQSLNWKVGAVWPGEYFISISNVKGAARGDTTLTYFAVKGMPDGATEQQKKSLCEESGGSLV